ncbi:CHAT domain-containing protein [Phormidium pseudopriestleyi FRX01]|uniref:CHAT domain-containing protein n=1 Tax=Phormidium pseudopriestleyi FRX01 TaxID=1759528 RepID=A0ABS3FLR8_9CYAN|nr:CHAT domain-containing protein [Phormidium pseudopriestleyi]MBO0348040.1 CHAT domain-containing protein [Phormidium pseudopriestleyi FRX01]
MLKPITTYLNSRQIRQFLLLTLLTILTIIHPHPATAIPPISQTPDPTELVQLGTTKYQQGQFLEATQLWEEAAAIYSDRLVPLNQAQTLTYLALAYHKLGRRPQAATAIAHSLELLQQVNPLPSRGLAILAQTLNTRGILELADGQNQAALETWKQAADTYDRAGDDIGKLGSQINQAQALQALGQHRRARTLLEQWIPELDRQPDTLLKADGLRSLGVALQTIGNLEQSQAVLEQSWRVSDRLKSPGDTSATLLNIGNIARYLHQDEIAITYYQQAEQLATETLTRSQAQLNQFSLFVALGDWNAARRLRPQLQSHLATLPPSQSAIYARVNFAANWLKMGEDLPEIAQGLAEAIAIAKELQDGRSQAYALTQLGQLYRQAEQWQEAETLTEQALQIAQSIQADEIIAPAAWQLGQILIQQQQLQPALTAYNIAFETLKNLRRDLVAISPDLQFDFKESVEPVYRELVSLLLQPDATPEDIEQARQVMEALQIAELDNFFREACLDVQPVQLEQIDTQAAAIYPIVLPDRLEVILSLPGQPLRHYTTPLSSSRIEATLEELRSAMHPGYSSPERLRLSTQVYDWLIRPIEADLAKSEITTLVFIPDGGFASIPLAALYDGSRYLIETYNTALSPGLQLFPQGLTQEKLTALTAGLTEGRQGFSPLPGVAEEFQQITQAVPGDTLLDRQFTLAQFEAQLNRKSYPIIHLATHGQFSSNPEETFLLTWDGRIVIKDFDKFFNKQRLGILKPIELLVMSACQTATGDKRATLGLAGFALRSGARSTLASLWSVHDQSTADLMSEFYRQLTRSEAGMTKTEALRQAQLALLNDPLHKHPYYWSAFILVGNWL